MELASFIEMVKENMCNNKTYNILVRPMRENKPFVGTSRYASIDAHKGHELGRKDDLESLGYVLIFLFKGINSILIN